MTQVWGLRVSPRHRVVVGGWALGSGSVCSSGVLPGSGPALTCCCPPHPGSSAGLLGMVVVMDGWGSTRAWRWCAGCAGRDTQRPPVPRPCARSEPHLRPHVAVCCAGHLWGCGPGWAACAAREEGLGTGSGADEGTTEPVRGLSGGFLGWASGSEHPPVNPLSACWNHLPRCLRGPRDVAVAVER